MLPWSELPEARFFGRGTCSRAAVAVLFALLGCRKSGVFTVLRTHGGNLAQFCAKAGEIAAFDLPAVAGVSSAADVGCRVHVRLQKQSRQQRCPSAVSHWQTQSKDAKSFDCNFSILHSSLFHLKEGASHAVLPLDFYRREILFSARNELYMNPLFARFRAAARLRQMVTIHPRLLPTRAAVFQRCIGAAVRAFLGANVNRAYLHAVPLSALS